MPIYNIDLILLYKDNIGIIIIIINLKLKLSFNKSKHINIWYYITCKTLANKIFYLQYIQTADMTADILIKALLIKSYKRYYKNIGLTIS